MAIRSLIDYERKMNKLLLSIATGILFAGVLLFFINSKISHSNPMKALYYLISGLIPLSITAIIMKTKPKLIFNKFILLTAIMIDLFLFSFYSQSSNSKSYTLIFLFLAFCSVYLNHKVILFALIEGILLSIIQFVFCPNLRPIESINHNYAMIYFAYIASSSLLFFVNKKAHRFINKTIEDEHNLEKQNDYNSRTIKVIKGNIYTLNNIEQKIKEFSEHLSMNSKEVAASVEEISSTIEELTISVNAIAENSSETSSNMNNTANLSENGMNLINDSSNKFEKLVESTSRIKDAISQIFDITDQTSLLALNANIEAARAGEAGKGFSVVAKEIQKLAVKSSVVARDIESTINKSNSSIIETYETSKETHNMFQTINDKIKKLTQLFSQISEATSEESKGTEDVIKSLDEITQHTETTVRISEEIENFALKLDKIAIDLNKIVEDSNL